MTVASKRRAGVKTSQRRNWSNKDIIFSKVFIQKIIIKPVWSGPCGMLKVYVKLTNCELFHRIGKVKPWVLR